MKIAISELEQIIGNDQHRIDNQIPEGMYRATNEVVKAIKKCGEKKVKLLCFSQWFVGFGNINNYPNKITEIISEEAKKYKINIVTGTFRIPGIGMKSKPVSLIIDNNGHIIGEQGKKNLYLLEKQWQLSDDKLNVFEIELGKIIVNHGDDCIDPEIYQKVKNLTPNIWVLQTNSAININKFENHNLNFEQFVKRRSLELGCTICVPMLKGEFMHVNYHGGSFICNRGEIFKDLDPDNLLITDLE